MSFFTFMVLFSLIIYSAIGSMHFWCYRILCAENHCHSCGRPGRYKHQVFEWHLHGLAQCCGQQTAIGPVPG